MNISSCGVRVEIAELRSQLLAHPELWDQHPWRTEHPRSPHREASDIWARYNAIENLGPHFNDPHEAVWYPSADELPALKPTVEWLMDWTAGEKLGGVLITKIPAHSQVYPHVDRGWHAEHYEKFAVLICGNPFQRFCFEDSSLGCGEGDVFTFNNQAAHWVTNDTAQDRITLICCIRRAH